MSTSPACPFSLDHYRVVLQAGLDAGYRFVGYDEIADVPTEHRACILRHDIDYTPEWAADMAAVEEELGIRAAYFFQVSAAPYNLREAGTVAIVRRLADAGHAVGLHFDMSWKPDAMWEELAALCAEDKDLFHRMTGVAPCEMVTIHNPHRFQDRILNQSVPGIRHSYERPFFSDSKYLSDSQGWYEGCMCGVFPRQTYARIQLLIHPYLWPRDGDADFVANIARAVRFRHRRLEDYLVEYHPRCAQDEAQFRRQARAFRLPDRATQPD